MSLDKEHYITKYKRFTLVLLGINWYVSMHIMCSVTVINTYRCIHEHILVYVITLQTILLISLFHFVKMDLHTSINFSNVAATHSVTHGQIWDLLERRQLSSGSMKQEV